MWPHEIELLRSWLAIGVALGVSAALALECRRMHVRRTSTVVDRVGLGAMTGAVLGMLFQRPVLSALQLIPEGAVVAVFYLVYLSLAVAIAARLRGGRSSQDGPNSCDRQARGSDTLLYSPRSERVAECDSGQSAGGALLRRGGQGGPHPWGQRHLATPNTAGGLGALDMNDGAPLAKLGHMPPMPLVRPASEGPMQQVQPVATLHAVISRASLAHQRGDRAGASTLYEQALGLAPEEKSEVAAQAHLGLSAILDEESQGTEAGRHYALAVQMALRDDLPTHEAHARFASVCGRALNQRRADEHFRLAVKEAEAVGPAEAGSVMLQFGRFCQQHRRVDMAKELYLAAAGRCESSSADIAAKAYFGLGSLSHEQESAAVGWYSKAADLARDSNPDLALRALSASARLSDKRGASEEAAEYRRQAAEQGKRLQRKVGAPRNAQLENELIRRGIDHQQRARMYAESGRPREAKATYEHALRAYGELFKTVGFTHGGQMLFLVASETHLGAAQQCLILGQESAAAHHFAAGFRAAQLGSLQPVAIIGRIEYKTLLQCAVGLSRIYASDRERWVGVVSDLLDGVLDSPGLKAIVNPTSPSRPGYSAQAISNLRFNARLRAVELLGGSDVASVLNGVESALARAEQLEESRAEHAACPLIDSAWDLAETAATALLPELRSGLIELSLARSIEAAELCQDDHRGAASTAPTVAAAEILLRTACLALQHLPESNESRSVAELYAQDLVRRESDVDEHDWELSAGRAQVCAALLECVEEHASVVDGRVSPRKAVKAMCRYANAALDGVSAGYRSELKRGTERNLDFRADRAALFRTHVDAHIRRALMRGARDGGERLAEAELSGAAAKGLFRAVLRNRSVIDLVEGNRLHNPGVDRPGGDRTSISEFYTWLRTTHAAWLELVVGLAYEAEILILPTGKTVARIRRVGWTNDGLPDVLSRWDDCRCARRNGEIRTFRRGVELELTAALPCSSPV